MTIICAWHPKNFGKPLVINQDKAVIDEDGNVYEPQVSHTLCDECSDIETAVYAKAKAEAERIR